MNYNPETMQLEGIVEMPEGGIAESIMNKIIWGEENVHQSLKVKINSNDN